MWLPCFGIVAGLAILVLLCASLPYMSIRLRLVFGDNSAFAALGNDVEIAHGLPPSGSICRRKSQQLVPVIFILFLPGFDFGRQTDF